MKLRIRGDSLRLRLTQGEVDALVERGRVEESTPFGASRLEYALVADREEGDLSASLTTEGGASRITVHVGRAAARAWRESDVVGLERTTETLRILVEKDFACLTPRAHEEDADAFPNPNETC